MNDSIAFKCATSLKDDVEDAAEQRGISTSEWLREAARRQLQDQIRMDEQRQREDTEQ